MAVKNPEWYNKLVLGSMDKHMIYGDLAHKYVDASVYTAVADTENSCTVLVKGIYKVTGTPKYNEIAATSEEVYRDYISGSMLICENTTDAPAFYRPSGMTFDLTKVVNGGASPITVTYAKPKASTSEETFEVVKCETKEHYTAA